MGKFFSRFFLLLLISIISLIIYLSYFGISTDKFDDIIKNRANEVNRYIKLEFQKTKIHLNLKELNLVVRLQNPKVIVKDSEIDLSKLNLLLSLDSFFSTNFLLERAEVAFKENDIKDLTKITRIFLPRIINNQLNKIFIKGNLEGEFIIPFESDGKISKDYGFSGKISDATINLTKDFSIKNLTTEIKNINNKDEEVNAIEFIIKNGFIYDLNLSNSKINLKREENQIKVKNFLQTNGKLNFSQIQKISSLFNLSLDNFKDIHGTADLKTDINFDLDKGFKIKNLSYSVEGNISHIEMHTTEKRVIYPSLILK